jgi:hypothetical protein
MGCIQKERECCSWARDKLAGDMAEVLEHMPSKKDTLISNLRTDVPKRGPPPNRENREGGRLIRDTQYIPVSARN